MHGGGVGPYWTPISPSAGSFFHADTHFTPDECRNSLAAAGYDNDLAVAT